MIISSYFTIQTDVRKIIIEHLDKAQKKVYVAVAWFTDTIYCGSNSKAWLWKPD